MKGVIDMTDNFTSSYTGKFDLPALPTQPVVLQYGAVADGPGTIQLVKGYNKATLSVIGTGTFTINWEACSLDGIWKAITGSDVASTTGVLTLTVTASGTYIINIAGFYQFRARISGSAGATVTIDGRMSR